MRYADLISNMTLEEKCSLLSGAGQFAGRGIDRLGIPAPFYSDGPSGVRKQTGASDHLGLNPSLPATCFPSSATMANAWDETLEEELGAMLGEEARAMGVNVLLGPGLNIKRSPLCGRNFEYFSEDPYLSGKLAAAYIRGVQSKGIAACPKHFAVNSQETLRMHSDSVLDRRTLREIYLTGFEIAVKEGSPKCLMSSYNRVNGVYASENKELLQDILRDEWGFQGFTVTDWGGSNDRVRGVAAGTHVEMPTTGGNGDRLVAAAVRAGVLSEEVLDQRITEYLNIISRIQLPAEDPAGYDQAAHHAFARRAAAESVVLLKNEGGLLPLEKGEKVAVIGDFAATPRYQGSGSSGVNPTQMDIPLDCLKESGLDVVGYAQGFLRHGGSAPDLLRGAVELAQKADVVLLCLGLDEIAESEGLDRQSMALAKEQGELLEAIAAVNPRVAVVLSGGAPMELPWVDRCQALVYGCLGGQAGAGAMADVLTGKVDPSGKLAESWPLRYEDTPAFHYYPGTEHTAEYREGLFVGYRYYDTAGIPVRFPFGYGLSYTTFGYSDLAVTKQEVRFTLTNTGSRPGAEVAQLYVSCPKGSVFRPAKELKGFAKVFLQPGESREVTIPLDDKAFRYFNVKTGKWETESGIYVLSVAAHSNDVKLVEQVEITGADAPLPYFDLPHYESGNIRQVPDVEFATLLGRPIPESKWDRTKPLELNDTFAQLQYAEGWVGRLVYRICKGQVERSLARGKPDLDALFRYNMPFRAIAKMTAGAVDMAMAGALVEIFNGHFFRGAGHLITAFFHRGKAESKEETP